MSNLNTPLALFLALISALVWRSPSAKGDTLEDRDYFRLAEFAGDAEVGPESASGLRAGAGALDSAPLQAELDALGLIRRSQWGARAGTCDFADPMKYRATVHHTAESAAGENFSEMLRSIQRGHIDNNDWCDIGYHFVITADGRIWEGRPLDMRGAHAAMQNTGNIGISLAGCFDEDPYCAGKLDQPTPAMLRSAYNLLFLLSEHYGFELLPASVRGHRDWPDNSGTVCPGDHLHQRLDEIRDLGTELTGCEVIGAEQTVIDDSGPCFVRSGSVAGWRWSPAGHDESVVLADAATSTEANHVGRWQLTMAEQGRYRVEVHIPGGSATAQQAEYWVRHAEQLDAQQVDQSRAAGWALLGEYQFTAGDAQWLELRDNVGYETTEPVILAFDAVRITRLVEEAAEDPSGGCAVTSQGVRGSWLLILLALVLGQLRRLSLCMRRSALAMGLLAALTGCGPSGEGAADASQLSDARARADGSTVRDDAMPASSDAGAIFGEHVIGPMCDAGQPRIRIAVSAMYSDNSCYPQTGNDAVIIMLDPSLIVSGETVAFSSSAGTGSGYNCPADENQPCAAISTGTVSFESYQDQVGALGVIEFDGTSFEFNASWCVISTNC